MAGYLGEDYEKSRILIIGKNPAKGKRWSSSEIGLYNLLNQIVDVPSLTRVTPELTRKYHGWVPLRDLQLETAGIKASEMAYSNQILCRCDPSNISDIDPQSREKIYRNCHANQVVHLIQILQPKCILAIGRKGEGANEKTDSWPLMLRQLLNEADLSKYSRLVQGVIFPFGCHKEKARQDVRNCPYL